MASIKGRQSLYLSGVSREDKEYCCELIHDVQGFIYFILILVTLILGVTHDEKDCEIPTVLLYMKVGGSLTLIITGELINYLIPGSAAI